MKIGLALLAAAATLASVESRAEAFASIGGGSAHWEGCFLGGSCDRQDGTWYGRAGFSLLPFIGIEARYADLGRAKSAAVAPYFQDSRVESRGAGVGAVFSAPIPLDLRLNAVAGVARMKTTVTVPDVAIGTSPDGGVVTAVGFSGSETKTKPYYGVGIDYRLAGSNLSVGAEATRYRIDLNGTRDVDAFTVSVTYRFL